MPSRVTAFEKIVAFHRRHQRMPSYQEIAQLVGYHSKNAVWKLVQHMLPQDRGARDARGRLLPTKYFHEIPWLGTVIAGYPSPAEEELLDTMSLEDYLGHNKDAAYLLRVTGDSMSDVGILPGDLVLVERRETPRSGKIVVAELDGEWTMKTYRKRGRTVTLEPANTARFPLMSTTSNGCHLAFYAAIVLFEAAILLLGSLWSISSSSQKAGSLLWRLFVAASINSS